MANTKTVSKPQGIFIEQLMEQKGLKNKDIAERMETTDATISRLLNGQRGLDLDWLHAFAKALDVPVARLFQEPGASTKAKTEPEVKALLKRIDGLPADALNPVWRLISGYIEDAE
jgi:transcriptional regulator with XRE-family HTH domain